MNINVSVTDSPTFESLAIGDVFRLSWGAVAIKTHCMGKGSNATNAVSLSTGIHLLISKSEPVKMCKKMDLQF